MNYDPSKPMSSANLPDDIASLYLSRDGAVVGVDGLPPLRSPFTGHGMTVAEAYRKAVAAREAYVRRFERALEAA